MSSKGLAAGAAAGDLSRKLIRSSSCREAAEAQICGQQSCFPKCGITDLSLLHQARQNKAREGEAAGQGRAGKGRAGQGQGRAQLV